MPGDQPRRAGVERAAQRQTRSRRARTAATPSLTSASTRCRVEGRVGPRDHGCSPVEMRLDVAAPCAVATHSESPCMHDAGDRVARERRRIDAVRQRSRDLGARSTARGRWWCRSTPCRRPRVEHADACRTGRPSKRVDQRSQREPSARPELDARRRRCPPTAGRCGRGRARSRLLLASPPGSRVMDSKRRLDASSSAAARPRACAHHTVSPSASRSREAESARR